jgi:hypothetical protein
MKQDDCSHSHSRPPKLLLYGLLLVAVVTCSSAAVVFSQLLFLGVPPFLAASWRLICQELMLFLPFLLTYRQHHQATPETTAATAQVAKEQDYHDNFGGENQAVSECSPLLEIEVLHKAQEIGTGELSYHSHGLSVKESR